MRVGVILLFSLTGLTHPEPTLAQGTAPPVRLQVSGLISGFRYERGIEAQWRGSTALRLRVLLQDRFFGEFSYTTPVSSEGPVYCPGLESCPPGTPENKKTDWWFSVLGGSLGFRIPARRWTASIGVGGGRLKSEGESPWSWIGFVGVERPLSKRWGMLFEYRGYRVDWPSEGLSWNHAVGGGLTLAF
jgi:hypothetical protein